MNLVIRYSKLLIFIFVIYLMLAPTHFVESGMMRFFPTLVLMIVALCGLLSIRRGQKAKMGSIIFSFCIYIIFCSLIHSSYSDGPLTTFLKSTYWCWMYFISYTIFSYKEIKDCKYDKYVLIITILLFIVFNYNHYDRSKAELLEGDNSIFYSLMFIPWACCSKSTVKRWVMVLLITICAIVALKRSGIIIILSVLVLLYYRDFLRRNIMYPKNWIFGVVVILCGILVYYKFSTSIVDVNQRFNMIEDDGGNGREAIYKDVISRYASADISCQLFGNGFNSVAGTDKTRALSAHNDFLEILYDFGAIGLFFYILIHISLIKWSIRLFKQQSPMSFPVLISYICFFVMSMVSHLVLYPTYFGLLTSFWAFAECKDRQLRYEYQYQ